MGRRENQLNLPIGDAAGGEWEPASAAEAVEDYVADQVGLEVLSAFGKHSGRRPSKPQLHFEKTRELTLDDALVMQAAPARKVGETGGVPSLQRIRTIHHQIARMLAAGNKIVHVAAALGITPVRIGQLQKDPAFIELRTHYEKQEEQASINLQERFRFLGTLGMEELQDRLLDEPDSFGNGHLMELVKLTVGGEAPKTNPKVNDSGLNPDALQRLKAQADSSSRSRISYRKNGDVEHGETAKDIGAETGGAGDA